MIILHASSWNDELVLWGETSSGSSGKKPRTATRRTGTARLARSRYALDDDGLTQAVSVEVPGFAVSKQQRGRWVAWLPSNDQGALPSSSLLAEGPVDQGALTLAPWEVPAIVLTTDQAVTILAAARGRTTWGPGVVAGKTLSYWATVLRFAGALVARQQYLPGVVAEADGTTFEARWEPVLTGEARLQAERLARTMPHA